jgi:Leucine-rich repeat (LRR) protein
MRRPILKLVLIVLAIFGTAAIAYAPLVCLNAFAANLFRTRALGWSDPAYSVTPREPHDVHFDRMLTILPFCPCVKEVRLVPVSEVRRRLAQLAKSPWIISLDLSNSDIVDEYLAALADMTQLEYLFLSGNPKLTDAGIAHLAKCTKLRHLELRQTSVTGSGFAALAGCQELRYLGLTGCPVTDEHFLRLPHFPKLENLHLAGTQVTDAGLNRLNGWYSLTEIFASKFMTTAAKQAFNEANRAARQNAREAGVPLDPKRGGRPFLILERDAQ